MSINYIDELNDSQRAAVLYDNGPSLVIAGAGSGKTRVLTYKIAHLLEVGYEPWSILSLTFTNKAAREMRKRIEKQVGERARYLWMGTFHSIFSRILRTECEALGFPSSFTIYDTADSKSLLKSIIGEMQLDDKKYKVGAVQSRISNAKNHLILPADYGRDAETKQVDAANQMSAIGEIYSRYWQRCRQAGAMDFDDLLVYTYKLLFEHPAICKKYNERFRYILVDEYQDTNFVQHQIVQLLTKENNNICVVGDDAQSIYSFRGANIDNILKFKAIYKEARMFKLEQNYRSSQNIVGAANSLILKNREQIRKDVFSEKEKGDLISLDAAYSDVEEGEIVANHIHRLHTREQESYADCAILYRTNAQSRIFEEAFRKRSIPYQIYGGLSFYSRKEIKDVIAYFRLAVNSADEEAFKRIINYPTRGIGKTTVDKITVAARTSEVSLWDTITNPQQYHLELGNAALKKLAAFQEMIMRFMADLEKEDAYTLAIRVLKESGIIKEMGKSDLPENLSKRENVEELVSAIHDFVETRQEEGDPHVGLVDFLSDVSLLTDQDTKVDDDVERITMMTIHAAKGLEFKNVFVVGLEQNLFPSQRCLDSFKALEEERRLFYVAITRAEQRCFLSYAKCRFKYGKTEFSNPSCFIADIDSRYIQPSAPAGFKRAETASRSFGSKKSATPLFEKSLPPRFKKVATPSRTTALPKGDVEQQSGIVVGQVIEHERFGLGDVLKVEGTDENRKATIAFRNVGTKQLLLKFARFKIIG